jgi:dTMP kinase
MRKERRKGFFITIEGMEATGKSSAIKYVVEWAKQFGLEIVTTKEPGGTEVGLALREVFLHNDLNAKFSPISELCTLFACKAQLLNDVVIPALTEGKIVICDRFTETLYAYQGGGKGYPMPVIRALEKATLTELKPDVTILMEVPLAESLARIKARNTELNNVMDFMPHDFYERVNATFTSRAMANSDIIPVNGNQGFDGVQRSIFSALHHALDERMPWRTGEVFEYTQSVDAGKNTIYTPVSKNV